MNPNQMLDLIGFMILLTTALMIIAFVGAFREMLKNEKRRDKLARMKQRKHRSRV